MQLILKPSEQAGYFQTRKPAFVQYTRSSALLAVALCGLNDPNRHSYPTLAVETVTSAKIQAPAYDITTSSRKSRDDQVMQANERGVQ